MGEFPRIERSALDIIPADGYHAGDIEILSCIGGNESSLGEKIGMEHIEWQSLVFLDDQLEPIHQGIVDAFVRPEARDMDSIEYMCSLLRRGQECAWTVNSYMMSCRGK